MLFFHFSTPISHRRTFPAGYGLGRRVSLGFELQSVSGVDNSSKTLARCSYGLRRRAIVRFRVKFGVRFG